MTWKERLETLQTELGRKPTLPEMIELSKSHTMTPEELQAQRESWVRGQAGWD